MSFNILDYENKLEITNRNNSWLQAVCPVCQGKLKINTTPEKYGAYSCFSNECEKRKPNPIRLKLQPVSAFRESNLFKPVKYQSNKLLQVIPDINLSTDCAASFSTDIPFERPVVIQDSPGERMTIFKYTDYTLHRVDRKGGDKFFYTQYEHNKEVIKGLPNEFSGIPVFQEKYIQSNLIVVEGEKCAAVCHKLGLAAISFPSFLEDMFLERYVYLLCQKNLHNVLILRDNDSVGLRKAQKLKCYFNKFKVACDYKNLADLFPEHQNTQGIDIADFYVKGLINSDNILFYISKLL